MKLKLLTSTLLLYTIISFSQEYAFGIKGGLNNNSIGTLYQRAYNNEPAINHEPNKELGYQLGAYVTGEFGIFFVQPEFNYVTLNNNYELPRKKAEWRTTKMEIPLLVGVRILKPVRLYLGPSFNFYDDTQLEGVQVTSYSDGGPDLDKNTMSFNFGVMFRYNRFGLDLRYERSNNTTEEELLDIIYSEYGTNLADLKPYQASMIRLSLFIDILRTDMPLGDLFKKKFCACPYD
ncbi:outer membrane beta-barrel protein [Aestuariibaculum sediminum]|uniref:PorT family protein n=1 Tax=Aestuariibaculum sediminum TaxID=2770637 RepID=A0A8J6Q343_9FLAO|nr:outer membrane beta-barrel protein [Aestuariibaculum sediminum]MBD0833044.1 PorT family protein [Aestuariibaculum sediminum]